MKLKPLDIYQFDEKTIEELEKADKQAWFVKHALLYMTMVSLMYFTTFPILSFVCAVMFLLTLVFMFTMYPDTLYPLEPQLVTPYPDTSYPVTDDDFLNDDFFNDYNFNNDLSTNPVYSFLSCNIHNDDDDDSFNDNF